jgi:hypothetical protein
MGCIQNAAALAAYHALALSLVLLFRKLNLRPSGPADATLASAPNLRRETNGLVERSESSELALPPKK